MRKHKRTKKNVKMLVVFQAHFSMSSYIACSHHLSKSETEFTIQIVTATHFIQDCHFKVAANW